MKYLKTLIKELFSLSIFKTIYFNLHYFGLRGFTFPVLVGKKFKLVKMEGKVIIPDTLEHKIFLGQNEYHRMVNHGYWVNSGTIEFLGYCHFGNGTYIFVEEGARLTLGNHTYFGGNDIIYCRTSISIGADTGISWDVTIMDNDIHDIFDESGTVINASRPISIGDHVWVGYDTKILKGATISNNCVVACGSTITKEFSEDNLIIGGTNSIIRKSIHWKA